MPSDLPARACPVRSLVPERAAACAAALALFAGSAAAQWTQWGGPNRDFRSPATGLADEWPEGGPTKMWERSLGPGYSSLIVEGERVYTQYRDGDEEVVVALAAPTGATLWEHRQRTREGEGPNATPVIAGERLYALGFNGQLSALDTSSGRPVWSHDLVTKYDASRPMFGFAASPLVLGTTLIVAVGGKSIGVAAFTLDEGKLLWRAHDFEEIYASPILIDVQGETQVAVLTPDRIVGLDPATGAQLWSEPIVNEGGQNIATPVLGPDGLLCVTSGTQGSVGLRLSRVDGRTHVERAWASDQQIAQTSVVRVGDQFLGSTGYDTNLVTALDARTGAVAWQHEGFSVTNLVAADGKLVLLDYEGVLALATASATGLRVHSRATVLGPQSFTPPTVSGARLYLRNQKTIQAFDLGPRE